MPTLATPPSSPADLSGAAAGGDPPGAPLEPAELLSNLDQLVDLLESGALSNDEFDMRKARLLGRSP